MSSVATFTLFGTDEDDQLSLHDMKAVFAGRFHIELGAGSDTLFLVDKDQTFDLVSSLKHVIRDVEFLDIRGTGNNTLSINSQTILDISEHSDTLVVLANPGDTVNIGSGWSLAGSQVDDGNFFRVLRNGTTQLLLHGPADHQNPFDRHDTNADRTVVPIDVLLVINELNSRSISNANGSVIDPATLTNFNNVFRDVNGDGFITPIDALMIINFLNARSGEAEGETNADVRNSSVPPVLPPVISLNVITLPQHSPNGLRVNRRVASAPAGTSGSVPLTALILYANFVRGFVRSITPGG